MGGKAVIVLSVITLLCMPFTGLLIKNTERTPVELKTEQNELIAKHGHTEYVIDINEIESVSLLYELPEGLKRRVGTATPTLLKGSFTSGETGNITLCIDQTVPPYILIETSTTRYLLNTGDTETTKLIFEQTEKQAE